MSIRSRIAESFGIAIPIIQAPMAGGGDTAELVAAVSNAGALGCIGAAYLTPEQIVERGKAVRSMTSRPFGINLFAPLPEAQAEAGATARAITALTPYYQELGIPVPATPTAARLPFDDQLAACLETGAAMFSFAFGVLPPNAIQQIKKRNLFLAGTATTVNEAKALVEAGVDAVVAQGSEAGGHRSTFGTPFEAGMIGLISLVPQIVDAVSVPVIASGGIMDGRGIAAAFALGASAVQMGTAFLTCDESGVANAYKDAILRSSEDQTRITRAFSGRPARGIRNRVLADYEDREDSILPFPLQNSLTRPLRSEATKQNRAEFLSLWAGQGTRLARRLQAAELVAQLEGELKNALEPGLNGISFPEFLMLNQAETERWHAWFQRQSGAVLDLPIAIANAGTIRGLLRHIFGVELRHAERLLNRPEITRFEDLPTGSVDALFSIGERSRRLLREFLDGCSYSELSTIIEIHTVSAGMLRTSKRKLLSHIFIHGIRHWAQLATALREAGHPADWAHDLVFMRELQ